MYLGTQTFVLRTDHSSLQWLLNFRDAENMLARWLTVLTAYSFEIVHRKGTKHGNADTLSRKPRHCKCDSCPDCKSTELVCAAGRTGKGRKKPCNTRGAEVSLSEEGSENIEQCESERFSNWIGQWDQAELKKLQREDVAIKKILDLKQKGDDRPKWVDIAMEGSGLKALWVQWSALVVYGGLLYRKLFPEGNGNKLYIQLVLPLVLRKEFFKELHSKRVAGHLGVTRTLAQVRRRFYWPRCKADIRRWCRQCWNCQQTKPGPGPGRAKLHQHPVGAPL